MPSDSLYEEDYFAWTTQQAEALRAAARAGSNLNLEWENLAEEIESLGRKEKNELESNIELVIRHLILIACSPAVGPRMGWRGEADHFRDKIETIISESPSLRARLPQFVQSAHGKALRHAAYKLREFGEYEAAEAQFMTWKRRGFTVEEVVTPGLFPQQDAVQLEHFSP